MAPHRACHCHSFSRLFVTNLLHPFSQLTPRLQKIWCFRARDLGGLAVIENNSPLPLDLCDYQELHEIHRASTAALACIVNAKLQSIELFHQEHEELNVDISTLFNNLKERIQQYEGWMATDTHQPALESCLHLMKQSYDSFSLELDQLRRDGKAVIANTQLLQGKWKYLQVAERVDDAGFSALLKAWQAAKADLVCLLIIFCSPLCGHIEACHGR